MEIGKSVKKALDEWKSDDFESAILHACNAVDATATSRYPNLRNRQRMIRFIRDSYEIINFFGMPGINLKNSLFPISKSPRHKIEKLEIADIIYWAHRCHHCHGQKIKPGFELIYYQDNPTRFNFDVGNATLNLPALIIIGLLASCVLAPENKDETIFSDGSLSDYWISTILSPSKILIDNWWGRNEDFFSSIAHLGKPPIVTIRVGNEVIKEIQRKKSPKSEEKIITFEFR